MKLPPEIQFHEGVRLLVFRPRGLLDERAFDRVITILGELEAGSQQPFDRFTDTSETDEVELNFQHIIRISLYRRLAYADRPPVKSAILATNTTMIHFSRLHALLTQGSPITVNIFQEREAAARWLDVPCELLGDGKGQTRPT